MRLQSVHLVMALKSSCCIFYVVLSATCLSPVASTEETVKSCQCRCKPLESTRMRTTCNSTTATWLLNNALERISKQSEWMSDMLAETRRLEEKLSDDYRLLVKFEQEVSDARMEIEDLKSSLLERNTRISELEDELSLAQSEIKLLEQGKEKTEKCLGKTQDTEEHLQSDIYNHHPVKIRPRDCADIQENGMRYSGIYTIYPDGSAQLNGVQVFCDLNTDGGHWTVIQRRQDGSETFERDWSEYKNGFGALSREFWLGNENIHLISSQHSYELRVDLRDFNLTRYFAVYDSFGISDESEKYSLSLGEYTGNAGDSLSSHSGWPFSTAESDNDGSRSGNCSYLYGGGGWWYARCYDANLNGRYVDDDVAKRIVWYRLPVHDLTSLCWTEMKIRPNQRQTDSN